MKVVSIDFDIIMSPSIELYNDWIGENIESIDDQINHFPSLLNLKADLYQYDCLTQYICKVFKRLNKDKIIFINSHEELVKKTMELEPFDLVNIDHHHDVGYNIKNWKIVKRTPPNCGNWVKYLQDTRKINSYIWIHNKNSADLEMEAKEKYITEDILFQNFNFDKLANETDYLVICKSFEWIPFDYQALYFTWENIYNIFYE